MNRRAFLKAIPVGAAWLTVGGFAYRRSRYPSRDRSAVDPRIAEIEPSWPRIADPVRDEGSIGRPPATDGVAVTVDKFQKIKDFDRRYADDFVLTESQLLLLEVTSARIERAQRLVGHGNFNLLSFDRLLRFAENYSEIGAFSAEERAFLEEIFEADAQRYGFFGEKVIAELTHEIHIREVEKIAGSGHHLFKGEPLEKFRRIRQDVGDTIGLTSGVRGVAKQFQLFLRKSAETGGNLSQASRSLAPPGYSFHARGDFDIGTIGLGADNFTEVFAETDEYKKMIDLGYVDIRYTETNPFGVRHEPWHIKIA